MEQPNSEHDEHGEEQAAHKTNASDNIPQHLVHCGISDSKQRNLHQKLIAKECYVESDKDAMSERAKRQRKTR